MCVRGYGSASVTCSVEHWLLLLLLLQYLLDRLAHIPAVADGAAGRLLVGNSVVVVGFFFTAMPVAEMSAVESALCTTTPCWAACVSGRPAS